MAGQLGAENLPDSMHQLKLALECPVCLTLPQETPIYQCENGHIVCKSCHPLLERCPQCRGSLGRNRNLFAESFLGTFSKECPFAKKGCSARILADNEENHKKACEYRELVCLLATCDQLVPLRTMRSHLVSQHTSLVNDSAVNGHYTGKLKLKRGIPETRAQSPPSCISFNDQDFFFMKVTDATGFRHFWVYGAGTSDQLSRISFRIQFWSEDGKLKVTSREPDVSIDKPKDEVIKDADGLILTNSVVDKFVQLGTIKYEITLLRS